jgi:isopenicillin N synthase-like dioxygenase
VKNHGIPENTITAVIDASKSFFSLPEEAKLKVGRVFIVSMSRSPAMFGEFLNRNYLSSSTYAKTQRSKDTTLS